MLLSNEMKLPFVSHTEDIESSSQIERFVNLSDAVIAIAVTLLILPLVDIASELHSFTLNDLVSSSGQQFLIFVLSFVVICRFWLVHHQLFRNLKAFNSPLFWLNALWLLTIVFLPFPTELIGKASSSNGVVSGLYILALLVTTLTGIAMQWVIHKNPQLHKIKDKAPLSLSDGIAMVVLLFIAFALTVFVPHVGPLGLFLLFASGPLGKLFSLIKLPRK